MKKAGKSKIQEEWEKRNLPKKEKEPTKDAGFDPKPETRNPKPGTRNPKPGARNPKPETRIPNPETRNLPAVDR